MPTFQGIPLFWCTENLQQQIDDDLAAPKRVGYAAASTAVPTFGYDLKYDLKSTGLKDSRLTRSLWFFLLISLASKSGQSPMQVWTSHIPYQALPGLARSARAASAILDGKQPPTKKMQRSWIHWWSSDKSIYLSIFCPCLGLLWLILKNEKQVIQHAETCGN